jgi:hypothetical protein
MNLKKKKKRQKATNHAYELRKKRQILNQTKETRGSWKPTAGKEIYIMKDLTQKNPDGFEVRNSFDDENASAYLPALLNWSTRKTQIAHTQYKQWLKNTT